MNFSARPTDAMLLKYTPIPTTKVPNPQPDCGTIWVEFNGDTSVGIKQLRTFAHHITAHNFHTGIFISTVAVTPSALKIIPSVLPSVIETFHEQDLLVNITKHELVPKHVLLSAQEKKALLLRYRVKESQLPRIQAGDPVVSDMYCIACRSFTYTANRQSTWVYDADRLSRLYDNRSRPAVTLRIVRYSD